jgi:hypothetical protein
VERGASDGAITDFGPSWSVWFVDPDGMQGEVWRTFDWSRVGIHGPQPLATAGA